MSTMEAFLGGVRAARAEARQRRRTRTRTSGRLAAAVAAHGLTVGALSCFTAAAALVAVPFALVVAGVSLLILEWRLAE